ncbi:hypothetical protein BASA81_009663 [Batrachochytrium salamandrivorans]|nr:hypothetical protein BASA81_009663 [Batrachochytrium salamandrivorans]
MCGILLVVQNSSAHSINENPVDSQLENTISSLCRANQRRGPDCYSSEKWSIPTHSDDSQVHVALHGWVLHLRGNTVTPQPFVNSHGNYTCFNGQIFGGIDVPLDTNDTHVLASCLAEEDSSEQHILNVLSRIRGEWAVVFYYKQTNTIYFGRDYLGRRSLLMHIPTHSSDAFLLSSVGPYFIKDDVKSSTDMTGYWTEVSTSGLFSINLSLVSDHWRDFETRITHIPWVRLNRFPADGDQLNLSLSEEKQQISSEDKHTEPRVAKLFCPSLMINTQLPLATDLPEIDEMDIRVCLPTFGPMTPISGAAKSLETALSEAVRLRTENIPIPTSGDARLGILFSGGLDCITLAALADRFIPKNEPIDLLNVGFENPRIAQHKVKIASKNQKRSGSNNASIDVSPVVLDDDAFNVPDRLTGRLGAAELCRLFPWREWRFVCINVPYAEAVEFRPLIISLMTPLYTAMDLSIAMAFWFASRGIGVLDNMDGTSTVYKSQSRVLLSGLGADEQLGGYSRHRSQFNKSSWTGLLSELQLDVSRISTRNLGRDDRIISSHGKEVRFPFLDCGVTALLCATPIHLKTDPRRTKGVGDKLILRLVAASLGLDRAAVEPKRAVQFGARTAKMEDGKQKGHDVLLE